jgi:ClpP class serine protease
MRLFGYSPERRSAFWQFCHSNGVPVIRTGPNASIWSRRASLNSSESWETVPLSAKWAALPSTIQAVYDSLASAIRGDGSNVDSKAKASASNALRAGVGVTVISVYGIIGRNLSQLETMCGGCAVNIIQAAIEKTMEDPDCECIVLDFDSPGGVVTGVPELADFIRAASHQKPIVAFTAGQCYSAAYWLASACDGIFCTKSADLGSIGVYVALMDETDAWIKEGYKLELFKAGLFKAAVHPGQKLDPDARALMQADVDAI